MAAKKSNKTEPVRQYESNLGVSGQIKTEVYVTNPKTVITMNGKLEEKDVLDLRFLIDGFLKEKGY